MSNAELQPNRRDVLLSAAGASALGLSGSFAWMGSSLAASVRETGFYSWKVGSDIEVISIYDGIWKRDHDENFITGATVEETKAALRKAGMDDSKVPIEFAYTILKTGGKI